MAAKVIVGAGGTSQPGWVSLNKTQLDIRDFVNWCGHFIPRSVDAILAEHVLEHLTYQEARITALNCYAFLRRGGYLRIAVPDANNPDPVYQNWNAPGGGGQQIMRLFVYAKDEPTHQVFYDVTTLTALLEGVGFQVVPLEFYGKDGQFYRRDWSHADGEIRRSFGHPYLKRVMPFNGTYNTSLIVDAVKP